MRFTKVGFGMFGALLALVWIILERDPTTAADQAVGGNGQPAAVIDA